MGEIINSYKISLEIGGKRLYGRRRHRWEDLEWTLGK
jgi:hypothetical protein